MAQPNWSVGKKPTEEMVRGWLHAGKGEEAAMKWSDYAVDVQARGMTWHITWDVGGQVYLDGEYRDAWTWEYRKGLKRNCAPCSKMIERMEREAHGKR